MPDITGVFLRWAGLRAGLHEGYWLVASLYLVVDARLSAWELVFLGTAQGVIALVCEVPAGVVADTISRKWALVIAHVLVGGSMALSGLVTDFPALVATQMLCGVGWTFASGADVAWVTDEIGRPERIARVLTAGARWERVGAAGGLVGFGPVALAIGRGPAMVVAGVAMVGLGLYVAAWFTERGFTPTRERRWRRSAAILRRGVDLARRDRELRLVLAATFLAHGTALAYGRLYLTRLVDLGFPAHPDPIAWFAGLGIVVHVAGALALRVVEARIDGVGAARRVYAAACFLGTVGGLLLAYAPSALLGSAGVLLAVGIAHTVPRAVGAIWVNRRTTSDVRATVQSFLAQVQYGGEILGGAALGALAQRTTITGTFACAAVLLTCSGVVVLWSRSDRR